MVTIRSYLNNIAFNSVSSTEKVCKKYLLSLLFIFIFYYIYFSLVLFPNVSTQTDIFWSSERQ